MIRPLGTASMCLMNELRQDGVGAELNEALVFLLHSGQRLEFGLVALFSRHAAAPVLALASERPPQFGGQRVQDGSLVRRGAAAAHAAAAAAAGGGRGAALRVGGLEQLAHEAEARLADVRAAGEHVEDGVDGAAEVSEGRDVGTRRAGSGEHRLAALQQTHHLEGRKHTAMTCFSNKEHRSHAESLLLPR